MESRDCLFILIGPSKMLPVRVRFDLIDEASRNGKLMDLLKTIPKEHWFDEDERGWSFLHFACLGYNTDAIYTLIAHGLDKDARCFDGCTPIHLASARALLGPLKALLLSGANPHARDINSLDVWDYIQWSVLNDPNSFVLASGRYLLMFNVRPIYHRRGFPPQLKNLEIQIDRCRLGCIALLQVKRAGKLERWDKFLLREIAYQVWATRDDEKWLEQKSDWCVLN